MPTFVHTEICDGCQGREAAACMYICPHDLMALDADRMKAYNQEPEQCWECQACVKAYGDADAEMPIGDSKAETATAYYDITFFDAFIGILRNEDELYWKIHWQPLGASREVADVSLDTKKEIIGEYFSRPAAD